MKKKAKPKESYADFLTKQMIDLGIMDSQLAKESLYSEDMIYRFRVGKHEPPARGKKIIQQALTRLTGKLL